MFTLLAIAQFVVVLDVAVVNVALPEIQHGLGFNANTLQWVVTAYTLTFGGFLLLGGRAADLFGRRRVLMMGLAGFTIFSLLIGLSQSALERIIFRGLQGLAAALMSPAALSTVLTLFKDGEDRNRALAMWTNVATGGAAAGLLLGGILSQFINWRYSFFINVPVGIVVFILMKKYLPAHANEERSHKSLDGVGALLVTLGLVGLVFGFSQAPIWGWLHLATLATLGGALLLLAVFVFNESRHKQPLMPLSIFKIRNVSGANLALAPITAALMGMFFLVSLYMTSVLQFKPLQVGLAFLPFPIILSLVSTRVSKMIGRVGIKPFLFTGPLLVAIGMALLVFLPMNGNYWINILPSVLIIPIGIGMTFMPLMVASTSGVPAHESGLASGLINTSQQMGGALGLAILSGIAASIAAGSANTAAATLSGYHMAFMAAAVFALITMIVSMTVIKHRATSSKAASAAAEVSMH